jgi:hypothetical protein
MTKQESLFELPKREEKTLVFKPIRRPLWTENKARLIARYLYYFVLIRKHGAYIDGFAAPQNDDLRDNWSAKLVLQSEPKFLRDFWLCDVKRSGIKAIREMVSEQPVVKGRTINILQGDFNKKVDEVLPSGRIKPSTAASFSTNGHSNASGAHSQNWHRISATRKSNCSIFWVLDGWSAHSAASRKAKTK